MSDRDIRAEILDEDISSSGPADKGGRAFHCRVVLRQNDLVRAREEGGRGDPVVVSSFLAEDTDEFGRIALLPDGGSDRRIGRH